MIGRRAHCPACGELVAIDSESILDPQEKSTAHWHTAEPPISRSAVTPELAEVNEPPPYDPYLDFIEPPEEDTNITFSELHRAGEAEMDMTPMCDVTFLLLIFFMVTATFVLQRSISIPTPRESEPSTQVQTLEDFEENPEYAIVRVDENNTFHIFVAGWEEEVETPSPNELLVKLREARLGNRQGVVPNRMLVLAHGDALHGKVVTALDSGTEVGMEEVKLVTMEDEE